jgi:hypothetical protein
MRPEGPTQAQADYLVKKKKYIKVMPDVVEGDKEFRLRATVFLQSQPGHSLGLVVMATAKKSPPRYSASLAQCCLRTCGSLPHTRAELRDPARVSGWSNRSWLA